MMNRLRIASRSKPARPLASADQDSSSRSSPNDSLPLCYSSAPAGEVRLPRP